MKRLVLLSAAVAAFAFPALAQRVAPLAKRANAISVSAEEVVAVAQSGADDGRDVTLRLFPDVTLTATLFAPQISEGDRTVITGFVKNSPDSSVVLATRGGELFGIIRNGATTYELRGSGANAGVYEINPAAFPSEQEPQHDEGGTVRSMSAQVVPAATGDSVIDVMVLYTAKARTELGGTPAILSMIDATIAETNLAYETSGVKQRIRLAHVAETPYDEDDLGGQSADNMLGVALSRLAGTTDGYMDDIHQTRDSKAADLVSLITKRVTSSCGIGRLGTPPRETAAFSVVDRTCAAANLSFAHELGHNMGLMHDRTNSDSSGLTSYAYGFQDPEGEFRTIMAYAAGCVGGCPRVPRFSNPDMTYIGKPTGVAITDTAKSANAALTLNQSALMVANLRGQMTAPEHLSVSAHMTSKEFNISTEEAVNRTKTFSSTDPRVYATLKVANFTGLHTVQRRWYSPDGALYASSATAYTGDGETRTFFGNIAISGTVAASRLGAWRIDWLLDGALVSSDTFSITPTGVRPCSTKWRGHC